MRWWDKEGLNPGDGTGTERVVGEAEKGRKDGINKLWLGGIRNACLEEPVHKIITLDLNVSLQPREWHSLCTFECIHWRQSNSLFRWLWNILWHLVSRCISQQSSDMEECSLLRLTGHFWWFLWDSCPYLTKIWICTANLVKAAYFLPTTRFAVWIMLTRWVGHILRLYK